MSGPLGRWQNREKTHCVNNHPLEGANIKLRRRVGYVERICRECRRHQERSRKRRRRA